MSEDSRLLDSLKQVTIELRETRERLRLSEARTQEPIAIVGMSCRYPGGVSSPEDLWQLVVEGRDAISSFPEDRGWDLESLFDPDPDHPGTSYVREGGFLDDVAGFDADFFGIPPREALAIDPQQRLLLEASWEALEDAGIDPLGLRGGDVGVFAGVMAPPEGRSKLSGDSEGLGITGGSASVVSGRIAYALGLEGPAVSVDTACSSSLVAIHLGARALRAGECGIALVGGVTVLAGPLPFIEFSRQRGLARDGRCKSFAAAADGTGWSEGVGLLVVERLSVAEREGHRVLATIRGSAVNQDGASNGLTAPNGPAQERVIRRALADAGLSPGDVDVVEAHGTGTMLGDPIEAGAIIATYGRGRRRGPICLGSLKSNIGHTQAAAGVGGVIKTVMAMRYGTLPRTLHVDAPSPHVDWDAGKVELLTEARAWTGEGGPRRAGISSFGVSGTNAHLILEDVPAPPAVEVEQAAGPPLIPLLLSAKGEEALAEAASRLAGCLRDPDGPELVDAAATLASGRAHLEHRAAVVGADREELLDGLDALAASSPHRSLVRGRPVARAKVAFMLSGQGSQRPGMGAGLRAAFPAYADVLAEVCAELDPHLDTALEADLLAAGGTVEAERLDRTEVTQPALFATEVALYRLLESFGLEPDFLIGHSIGELAAAHLAGVLSLPDACALVAARGRLMGALPEGGAMVAIEAAEDEVGAELGEGLSLAAVNAPSSVVVSGEETAVLALAREWEARGRKTTRLRVSHAFHSTLIDPMLEEFAEVAAGLSYGAPRIPVISNLTGVALEATEAGSPDYWVRQAGGAVRFAAGIEHLRDQGATTFLELGPGVALCAMARETLGAPVEPTPLLREGHPEPASLVGALAQAHADGVAVDWRALLGRGATSATLPTYPFQRSRLWLDPAASGGDATAVGQAPADHPLLRAVTTVAGTGQLLLSGRLSLRTHPWLADHVVHGTVVLPGTTFLELALRAAREVGVYGVEELTLAAPLVLPSQGHIAVQVTVAPPDERDARAIEIHARPEGNDGEEWTLHASGALVPSTVVGSEPLGQWPPPGCASVDVESVRDLAAGFGIDYGPAFSGLGAAWRREGELFGEIASGEVRNDGGYIVHPALLDAALQIGMLAQDGGEAPRVPFSWRGVRLHDEGAANLRARVRVIGGKEISLEVADEAGAPLLSVESLALRELDSAALHAPASPRHLFELEWRKVAPLDDPLVEADDTDGTAVHELLSNPDLDPAEAAHELCGRGLGVLQEAVAENRRVVIATRGAQAVGDGDSPDPAAAAVWGLVRSAQAEHPGLFALLDLGADEEPTPAAIAATVKEPQIATRAGALFAPRLVPSRATAAGHLTIDPECTVLITGATGDLGSLLARHLVERHGARRLLLVSRSGPRAAGVAELRTELAAQGASVEIRACDVGDRAQVAQLLEAIPAERALGAVFHCAGTLDDGVVDALDRERLDRVLVAKADAAWHLHELTADLDLSHFVLFSSVAGTFNHPGQGNYAAANAFLDGLARRRRGEGLPALSLSWGGWGRRGGMLGAIGDTDRARLARSGIAALSDEQGLELLDRSLTLAAPHLLPVVFDRGALRSLARYGALPPLFAGIVKTPPRPTAAGDLAKRLAAVAADERAALVLGIVRSHVAAVLGHASGDAVDPERAFSDLGFDSLAAVELRNRLAAASGIRLSGTLVFDYPNAAAVARFLLAEIEGTRSATTVTARARDEEPIAIVGMSCRYPGGITTPDELWRLVAEGGDAISPFPDDRGWDLEALYDPDPDHPGTSYAREGGFIERVGDFDADFFGISPREALLNDPQQRLMLETAWEALESAGIDPLGLRGSETGVFTGVMYHDYARGSAPLRDGHRAPEPPGSVVSGRIAYTLGLEGPAFSLDTACSSSLVTIHLASQALREGECDLALAGGITVMATPGTFIEFSHKRALAKDGRCKPFSDAADGTGWSEGAGLVVLERLSVAEQKRHQVLATIRGSAVSQDGASNGLTAPNGPAQERVIRRALANAGLSTADVDVIEAHGTGTELGDPIEAGAILATYGRDRAGKPIYLGSLKSNIGHSQAAAGVGGVIKMALAMRHELMPRTLHAEEPSSHVDWAAGEVELLNEARPWSRDDHPRRAGISSFGISGTNAHLILEEAPTSASVPERCPRPAAVPLLLSAKTEDALGEQAARLGRRLRGADEAEVPAVAVGLATGRAHLEHRAAVIGTGRTELLQGLDALSTGEPHRRLVRGRAAGKAKVAFVFPGQGGQWEGMAAGLLDSSSVFAERLGACQEALSPHLDFSLVDVLRRGETAPSLERLEVVQPTLFAVAVSLAALWRANGVEPAAVIGHSQGEIAAACVAGALSLEDAARASALRGRALARIAGRGGMASLALGSEQVTDLIGPWEGALAIAAENSPAATVVSGDADALKELLESCERNGVRARAVAVDFASHSRHVEALREELLEALAPIEPRPAEVPIYSTVTGERVHGDELDTEYWYRNLRQSVLFGRATAALLEDGFDVFIEASPHPVVGLAVQESAGAVDAANIATIASLRRDEGGPDRFLLSLAQAHAEGVEVDWEALLGGRGNVVGLPTYPFRRSRYWIDPSAGEADAAALGQGPANHPLLSAVTTVAGSEQLLLSGRLELGAHPWLSDHVVAGTVIVPSTAYIEMCLRAGREVGLRRIEELALQTPLALSDKASVALQVHVGDPDQHGAREVEIHSRAEGDGAEWTLHALGRLAEAPDPDPGRVADWPPSGADPVGVEDFYERTADLGIEFGPSFQLATAIWRRGSEVFSEVEPGSLPGADGYAIHPALMDAALHAVFVQEEVSEVGPRVPFVWRGISLYGESHGVLRTRLRLKEDGASFFVTDLSGSPVLSVDSLAVRQIDAGKLAVGGAAAPRSLLAVDWVEVSPPLDADEEPTALELAPDPELPRPQAAEELCGRALAAMKEAIAEPRRLTFVTRAAQRVGEGESPDPAATALWGLVRSAQAEHPGLFALLDLEEGAEIPSGVLAATAEEPQLAVRDGVALAPRLAPAPGDESPGALDPDATVLITGGTGGIGSLLARHLAAAHGARRFLLVSRGGSAADGVAELCTVLDEHGAEAEIRACDVADRDQLAELIATIPVEHPLGAVFHCAASFDNSLIASLDEDLIHRAFAPKADAAWHLHELTADLDLSHFVLFSSVAGTFNNPGQGNYAAANAFLDGLAHRRHAEGLPATAVAWGLWERDGQGGDERLGGLDMERLARDGIVTMSPERALELLDRVLERAAAFFVAAPLEMAALRARARAGALPPLLAGLVQVKARRQDDGPGRLADRFALIPEAERADAMVELVRAEAAAVLGHSSAEALDPQRSFRDAGFDSLAAVELRNRLTRITGEQLPATVVFDYPSATALGEFVLDGQEGAKAAAPVAPVAGSTGEPVIEPIAIVGMSCRFPGGVSDPEELWELLAAGRDAISPLPEDRGWDLEALYDPDPDHLGTSHVRVGGFLEDVAGFDADFFGIPPREALATDPQQRLLLEVAWEALEDAGIDPLGLRGGDAGVFTGVMPDGYGVGAANTAGIDGYGVTSSGSVVSGRIAYALGLEGAAVSVDTACSSSLVAIHLAAQALRAGECSLALVGGVTAFVTPGLLIEFSRMRALAADGRCKAFADGADGTGLSEGAGLLVLERLSVAEREGHRVLATIRGSAVNQDGASNGLTAPNGPSQERVIRRALADAGLAPHEVDAVEAHGTGTVLGDPIEAGAILATYGRNREGKPAYLGSLKSNIGHAQAAAGVGGVMKMVLAMQHGTLPRTLHVDAPSSYVDWDAGAVELLREAVEWQPGAKPRRAGVSAFGMSGTNAHVILEEPPGRPAAALESDLPPLDAVPLLLSAKSEEGLGEQAALLAGLLRDPDLPDPLDVALSLATRRPRLEHRAAVVAADREELLEGLDALAAGRSHHRLVDGRAAGRAKLAFMLSGQGSQRPGMGAGLRAAFPAYADALGEVCAQLDSHLAVSLEEHILADEGTHRAERLDHTELTQPALFATEVALFRLLAEWGLKPDFLIGHSIGELAAAHLAGVLSLPDACALVAARGRLMGALPQGGAMVAIEAAEDEVGAELGEGVSLAAVNAPSSVVVSGEEGPALAFARGWEERGRRTARLRVSHAFHSESMEPMLAEFAAVAARLSYAEPQIPVVSGRTGELVGAEEAVSSDYWVRQAREPVRFADGIARLRAEGVRTFLEVGPGAALCAMVEEGLGGEASATPVMRGGRPEGEVLLAAVSRAHAEGAAVDWEAFFAGRGAKPLTLPTYPFRRSRYWLPPVAGRGDAVAVGQASVDHPLLGATVRLVGSGQVLLSGRLSLTSHPWLADHAIHGTPIVPGTAFLELALRAAREVGLERVEELTLSAPLVLPAQGGVALQVEVAAADEAGVRRIEIHSRPDGDGETEWTLHAIGGLGDAGDEAPPERLAPWPPRKADPFEVESVRDIAAGIGVDYGPAFAGLSGAWRHEGELFGEATGEGLADTGSYAIHPALLDAVLQVGMLIQDGTVAPRVPFSWRGVRLHAPGGTTLRARLRDGEAGEISVEVADGTGMPVLTVESLVLRAIDPGVLQGAIAPRSLFALDWVEIELPADAGGAEPPTVLELRPDPKLPPAEAAEELCARGLAALQEALAGNRRLVIVTRGAQAVGEGTGPDPAAAAVWGLVRSAQAEHPGLFALLDLEADEEPPPAALLVGRVEHRLAHRRGALLAPRLAPATARDEERAEAPPLDPARIVLITGATGGLGSLLARHLVAVHGARHLLLVNRSGPGAEGADELRAELEGSGAEVELCACDVGDRDQVAHLLASLPDPRSLGAVFHCAGTLDDGVVEALDRERLHRVFAPKAAAAAHLHEFTVGCELTHFVLFSSIAGTFNNPGQGNYAAANAFLDALAWRRREEGLPSLSLGWGGWAHRSGMLSGLGDADRARLSRAAVSPLKEEEGLQLLDRCLTHGAPHLLPVALDRGALRALARAGSLSPVFAGIVAAPPSVPGAGALVTRLLASPEDRREALVLESVRSHVAAVLGHTSIDAVEPDRAFKDLGFDSLAAVELRNRLGAASGRQLPASIVFDYPNPESLAVFLLAEIIGAGGIEPDVEAEVAQLEASLAAIAPEHRKRFRARLQDLLLTVSTAGEGDQELIRSESDLESVSDEELFQLIDKES